LAPGRYAGREPKRAEAERGARRGREEEVEQRRVVVDERAVHGERARRERVHRRAKRATSSRHGAPPVAELLQQRAGERHLERALGDRREARTAAR
jgi:hypothetical protein